MSLLTWPIEPYEPHPPLCNSISLYCILPVCCQSNVLISHTASYFHHYITTSSHSSLVLVLPSIPNCCPFLELHHTFSSLGPLCPCPSTGQSFMPSTATVRPAWDSSSRECLKQARIPINNPENSFAVYCRNSEPHSGVVVCADASFRDRGTWVLLVSQMLVCAEVQYEFRGWEPWLVVLVCYDLLMHLYGKEDHQTTPVSSSSEQNRGQTQNADFSYGSGQTNNQISSTYVVHDNLIRLFLNKKERFWDI